MLVQKGRNIRFIESDQVVRVVHFAEEPELIAPEVGGEEGADTFTYDQSSFSVTAVAVSDSASLQSGRYVLYSRDASNNKYYALVPGNPLSAVEVQLVNGTVQYEGDLDLVWNVQATSSSTYNQTLNIYYEDGGQKRYLSNSNSNSLAISNSARTWTKNGDDLFYSVSSGMFSNTYYYLRSNGGTFGLNTRSSSSNVHFAKEQVSHIIHYGYEDENGVFHEWTQEDMGLPDRIGAIYDLEQRAGQLCDLEGYHYVESRLNTESGIPVASLLYTDAPYYEPGTNNQTRGTNYYNAGAPEDWSYTKGTSNADLSHWRYRMLSDWTKNPCNEDSEHSSGHIASNGITKPVPFTDTEKDIYVIYKKDRPVSEEPEDPQADAPEAKKSAKANLDGTYDITLSVKGAQDSNKQKANVVLILDTSWSMYTRDAEGGQRRIDATVESLKIAVDNFLALNEEDSTKVQLAFLNFAQRVRNEVNGNTIYEGTDGTAIKQAIEDTRNKCAPGTNWEAALDAANRIDFGDDDRTYIVFITDGNPVSCERPYGTYSDWDGNTFKNNAGNSTRYVTAAENVAQAITDSGKILYKIGAYSTDQGMDANMNALSGTYLENATANSPLSSKLAAIINDVTKSVSYQNVEVRDGITDLSSTTMVSGTADCFTYTITDDLGNKAVVRVNQKGEVFGLAMNPADPSAVTGIADSATVKVAGNGGSVSNRTGSLTYTVENTGQNDANGVEVRKITITVTSGNQKLFEAATTTASYSTNSSNDKTGPKAVEWSLAPLGTLDSRYILVNEFDCRI